MREARQTSSEARISPLRPAARARYGSRTLCGRYSEIRGRAGILDRDVSSETAKVNAQFARDLLEGTCQDRRHTEVVSELTFRFDHVVDAGHLLCGHSDRRCHVGRRNPVILAIKTKVHLR